MPNRWRLAFLALAAIAIVAVMLILAVTDSRVTVTIHNLSQQTITQIRLEHEQGTEIAHDLAPSKNRTMRFDTKGETSYQLRVRFADDSELTSDGEYAEPGYSFIETVTDAKIKTEHAPLFAY